MLRKISFHAICLASYVCISSCFHSSGRISRLHVDSSPMMTFPDQRSTFDNLSNNHDRQKKLQLRSTISSSETGKFDFDAVAKYAFAIAVQLGLITLAFSGLDRLVNQFAVHLPQPVILFMFYFIALKSRIFNPLANNRPNAKSLETTDEPKRKMPSFTPPGFVFPIVWLLIIGPVRAASSCIIYQKLGSFASMPILALMLHLSIGDVWNTINNVERRYGASVIGVFCVWLSKAHAAYQYYQVDPLAGKLLGATLIWLTIASTLITATWRLNPDKNGNLSPLYPVTGVTRTKFSWFADKEIDG